MSETEEVCAECGARHAEGGSCQEDFYQMLAWEADNPAYGAEVHHLMVLCYHLQHPALYSPEGLDVARQLLIDFLVEGVSTQEARRRNRVAVSSSNRKWKIIGTPERYGTYHGAVPWSITAADVVAGGESNYCDNVRSWAKSVHEALMASGNL